MSEETHDRMLVTGATGFLARHLLPLLPRGLALVRTEAAWASLQTPPATTTPVIGTLGNVADWSIQVHGVGAIVHLAALVRHSRREAEAVYRTNVDGTLAMVRLAAASKARLLFVSTSGTVGCFATPDQMADEDSPYCQSVVRDWPYYRSKMQAEIMARELAARLGVELIIVRLPVLIGPGDHRGRSTALLRRIAQGQQRFVTNGGIAFADVRDVAQGIAGILAMPTPRPIYHLAGTSCRLTDFCRLCADLAGVRPPRWRLPSWVVVSLARLASNASGFAKAPWLPDPVVAEMAARHWGFTSRWSHEVGYAARPVCETLADTIAWVRAENAGGRHGA